MSVLSNITASDGYVWVDTSTDEHEHIHGLTPAEARALAAELIKAAALCEGRCPECDSGWRGSYPCGECNGTGKAKP